MEIDELLDEKIAKFQNIENHSGYDSTQSSFDQGESAGSSRVAFEAINDLKELKQSLPPEQETTEFPEHIVKYLDICNYRNKPLIEVIGKAKYHDPDYIYWTEEETRNIAIAYSTGNYTVKKGPLYEIRLPYEQWDEDAAEVKTEVALLAYNITSDETKFVSIGSKFFSNNYKTKLTEERIKLIDERYWAFAVPVEEEAE